MKGNALSRWFWKRLRFHPFVRQLRPRIMAMVLILVLPLSLTCIAVSVVSVVQGRALVRENGQNTFSMYMGQVVLRCRYENVNLSEDFPMSLTDKIPGLAKTVEELQGMLYLSVDGREAWQVMKSGIIEPVAVDFDSLIRQSGSYFWENDEPSLKAVILFRYDLSLSALPVPFWVGMILSLLTLLFCPFLYGRLRLDILEPMAILDTALKKVKSDRGYRIPQQPERYSDEFLHLFDEFNDMAGEVQLSYEKDVKMLETEMDNLRLQVNPHMLLNSFNMIYALAESKNYAVIQDYTLCLVDYFRYVLRRGQKLVTIRQELAFVDNFIRIQRIRFPGRFSYVYQASEEEMDARIPPLLIENFVENAIKYALEPTKPIEIVVSVRKEEDAGGKEKLHIAIADTGSGIRPEILERLKAREPYIDEAGQKHIGIYNCFRRIELFYGEEGDIHFASGKDQGTQIYLIVPYRQAEEEADT